MQHPATEAQVVEEMRVQVGDAPDLARLRVGAPPVITTNGHGGDRRVGTEQQHENDVH